MALALLHRYPGHQSIIPEPDTLQAAAYAKDVDNARFTLDELREHKDSLEQQVGLPKASVASMAELV
jgi:hypothetical protein